MRARSSELRATDVSGAEIPGLDEIPVLAVAAARAKGATAFTGIDELVVKESNRLATISSELAALGGRVEAGNDRLVVHGPSAMHGGALRSHGDHRIAMAMAVAALGADGATTIDGWDAVATSYPEFEDHLRACAS